MNKRHSTLRQSLLLLVWPCSLGVAAQSNKTTQSNEQPVSLQSSNESDSITGGEYVGKIYDALVENPHFPGGKGALLHWLSENIHYPSGCACVQGRVVISFFVEPDGSISDIELLRKVDPLLDEEALRVVKAMPKWIPSTQNNIPIRAKMTMPIEFRLE